MSIYEIVFIEISKIFNYNVDWLPLANEIMSYIITTLVLIAMLIIPTLLFLWLFKSIGGIAIEDTTYISSGRRKRRR